MNEQELDDGIEETIQDARNYGCGQRHINEVKEFIGKRLLEEIEKKKVTTGNGLCSMDIVDIDDIRKVFKDVLGVE